MFGEHLDIISTSGRGATGFRILGGHRYPWVRESGSQREGGDFGARFARKTWAITCWIAHEILTWNTWHIMKNPTFDWWCSKTFDYFLPLGLEEDVDMKWKLWTLCAIPRRETSLDAVLEAIVSCIPKSSYILISYSKGLWYSLMIWP